MSRAYQLPAESAQCPQCDGGSTWEGKDPDYNTLFHLINVELDLVETMRMELIAGRSFRRIRHRHGQLHHQRAGTAIALGKENPLGETLEFWGRKGQVIGVVEDFHMANLSSPIEPTIIRLDPEETGRLWCE